jgi:hypothetical protein
MPRFYRINLLILAQILDLQDNALVLFVANWEKLKSNHLINFLSQQQFPFNFSSSDQHDLEIFILETKGGDDVETWLVDILQQPQTIKALPFLGWMTKPFTLHKNATNKHEICQLMRQYYIYSVSSLPVYSLNTETKNPLRNSSWRTYQPERIDYVELVFNPKYFPLIFSSKKNSVNNNNHNNNDYVQLGPQDNDYALSLMITGDRSSVGKSTFCLLLLHSLLTYNNNNNNNNDNNNVAALVSGNQLAYLKPITQCEQIQPVTRYCQSTNIPTLSTSIIIFYPGFTRNFLESETFDPYQAQRSLQQISDCIYGSNSYSHNNNNNNNNINSVYNLNSSLTGSNSNMNSRGSSRSNTMTIDTIATNSTTSRSPSPISSLNSATEPITATTNAATHPTTSIDPLVSPTTRLLLIDGVGYPSVGSICHLSNADVAYHLNVTGILIVNKSGVGDAIDSWTMNHAYFQAAALNIQNTTHNNDYHFPVIGAVFNKFPINGYYAQSLCQPVIETYFTRYCPQISLYGCLTEYDYTPSTNEDQDDKTKPPSHDNNNDSLQQQQGVEEKDNELIALESKLSQWNLPFQQQMDSQRLCYDLWRSKVRNHPLIIIYLDSIF